MVLPLLLPPLSKPAAQPTTVENISGMEPIQFSDSGTSLFMFVEIIGVHSLPLSPLSLVVSSARIVVYQTAE